MTETTDILHNEGIKALEEHHDKKIRYITTIGFAIFFALIILGGFLMQLAYTCKIQDLVNKKQQEIILQYKRFDYIKKGEVKVLRPKRND